jgi:hypothetical protein
MLFGLREENPEERLKPLPRGEKEQLRLLSRFC